MLNTSLVARNKKNEIVLSSKIEKLYSRRCGMVDGNFEECCDHLQSENQLILFGCGCILNAFGFWDW